MDLEKDKFYLISCKGYHGYDAYSGKGKFLGEKHNNENWFLFEITPPEQFPNEKTAYFGAEDIIGEVK